MGRPITRGNIKKNIQKSNRSLKSMIKGLKICGVSDPETLNYILNHNHKPTMIGFIVNYEKSKRFVETQKIKRFNKYR